MANTRYRGSPLSGLTYRHMPRVGAKTEQAWDRLGSLTVIKVLDIPAWDAVCDLGHRRLGLSLALELLNVTTPRARVAGQRPSPPAPARRPDHSGRPQVHYSRRQHLQKTYRLAHRRLVQLRRELGAML